MLWFWVLSKKSGEAVEVTDTNGAAVIHVQRLLIIGLRIAPLLHLEGFRRAAGARFLYTLG